MSDWRDKAKANVADKSQGDRFKLVEGQNTFRILPNAKAIEKDAFEKYPPYAEYLVHKNVGPNAKIVVCGKDILTREGECWLCDEVIERYNKSGKASKKEVAKKLEPAPQMIMQVARWDRSTESLRGPLKFYVPGSGGANSISVKIEGLLANSRRHYDHPKKGYNITISRTGTGKLDTRYGAPEPDESSSKVSSSILRKVKPFAELVDEYDEEFQRAVFYGEQVADASSRRKFEKEEDNNMPMKKKKKDEEEVKKTKKKGKKEESESESASGSESESTSGSESESEKKTAEKKRPGRPVGSKGKKKKEESESESASGSESESTSGSESESTSGSESESASGSESESEPKKAKKNKKR